MANSEKEEKNSTVHLIMAFRRNKDNADGPVLCCREIVQDLVVDLRKLEARISKIPGVWRIHKTVNARDVMKASKTLMCRLIENPERALKMTSLWKTCLLQKGSKADRKFMFDVDDPAEYDKLCDEILKREAKVIVVANTPSGGYHVVTKPIDTRGFDSMFKSVTLQRDGYIFLKKIEIK